MSLSVKELSDKIFDTIKKNEKISSASIYRIEGVTRNNIEESLHRLMIDYQLVKLNESTGNYVLGKNGEAYKSVSHYIKSNSPKKWYSNWVGIGGLVLTLFSVYLLYLTYQLRLNQSRILDLKSQALDSVRVLQHDLNLYKDSLSVLKIEIKKIKENSLPEQ